MLNLSCAILEVHVNIIHDFHFMNHLMLCALLRCSLGVINLENIERKALDCTTGPKMSQQAKEKLAKTGPFHHWCIAYGEISLLANYFANSEFLRVCSADFAILTQNSISSIQQCIIFIQQHTHTHIYIYIYIYTAINIFHGNFNI